MQSYELYAVEGYAIGNSYASCCKASQYSAALLV